MPIGTCNQECDDEGNRTKRTELSTGNYTTYTWGHRNRLTDLRTYDDDDTLLTHVHYTYDARDLRIGKDVDETGSGAYTRGERYVYDVDDNLVLVYAVTYASGVPVAGSLATRQFSAATYDALFASESATGDLFWALTDHLGTVRDVTDADGDAIAHFTYGAFGEITSVTTWDGSGTPTVSTDPATIAAEAAKLAGQTYTAREWDPDAGMFYYRARWFDQTAGRFLSDDPLGFGAGDVNVQRYVGNDVTRATDPTGRLVMPNNGIKPFSVTSPFGWVMSWWFESAIPEEDNYNELIATHDSLLRDVNRILGTNYTSLEDVPRAQLASINPTLASMTGPLDPRREFQRQLNNANRTLNNSERLLTTSLDVSTTACIATVAGGGSPRGGSGRGGNANAGNHPPKRVTVDASRSPEAAAHLEQAGGTGRPLTVNRSGAAANRADALRGKPKVPGQNLDEVPPAVLRQPGDSVSVRPITPGDNRSAGSQIGNQIRGVGDGEVIIIEIINRPK